MEKMPFPSNITASDAATSGTPSSVHVTTNDWRQSLPLLTGDRVTVRELRLEDAQSLFSMISSDEVARFISPPPSTVDGYERFIAWAIRERQAGRYICFAVVPDGLTTAVGLFQLRSLETGFGLAEWGFALGSGFWGTGLFVESAKLVLDFAFDVMNVHRIEARASIANGRGNGALRKIGAVQEGVLRRSFLRGGHYQDQALWSLLAEDWRVQRLPTGPQVH